MLIEFQLNADKFLALMRSKIKSQTICIPDIFIIEDPFTGQDVAMLVDHIKIHDTTRFQRKQENDIIVYDTNHVSGASLQIIQPISIYLARYPNLGNANTEPLASYDKVDLELEFDFFASRDKEGWNIHLSYSDIKSVQGFPVPDDIKQQIQNLMQATNIVAPLDLSALKDIVGTVTIAETFIGAPLDLSFIAIRIELFTLQLEGKDSWEKFLNGEIENHLVLSWTEPGEVTLVDGKPVSVDEPIVETVSGNWSLFVEAGVFLPVAVKRFKDGLAKSNEFELNEIKGIDMYWDCAGHLPRVVTTFSGLVTGIGAVGQSVGVDVKVKTVLSAADAKTLSSLVVVEYDPNDWDLFAVYLVNAVPGAFLGAVLGGGAGPIGGIIGAIAGYVAAFVAIVGVASAYEPALPAPPDCSSVTNTEFHCLQPVEFPSSEAVGNLALSSVQSLCGGPLLMGSMEKVTEFDDVIIDSVEVNGFEWAYEDPCGTATLTATALVAMHCEGNMPLHLCAWSIPAGTDPANQLQGHVKVTELFSTIYIEVIVPAQDLKPAYVQQLYDFQLLLQTNGGVRLVTIPALKPLSDEEKKDLDLILVAKQVNCQNLIASYWSDIGVLNPKWIVDPPPEFEVSYHLWEVSVFGLDAGEQLVIRNASGDLLGAAWPSLMGYAQVDVLLAPVMDADEIVIARDIGMAPLAELGERADSRITSERRVRIVQTLLHQTAELKFGSPCTATWTGYLSGTPVLACILENGRHALYDLSIPSIPVLRRRVDMPGLRGVIRWEEGFLIWGEAGLRRLTRNGYCADSPASVQREQRGAVSDVVSRGGVLYAIIDGRVHIYNAELERVGTLDVTAANKLSISGAILVVHTSTGLTAYKLTDPQRPEQIEGYQTPQSIDQSWLVGAGRVGRILTLPDGAGGVGVWMLGRSDQLD